MSIKICYFVDNFNKWLYLKGDLFRKYLKMNSTASKNIAIAAKGDFPSKVSKVNPFLTSVTHKSIVSLCTNRSSEPRALQFRHGIYKPSKQNSPIQAP